METMPKRTKKKQNDRISHLPDHLLHFIMLKLCARDAVRMLVLSKRWEMIWATFPVIDIDEENYFSRRDVVQSMQLYLLRHQITHLQKLRLRFIWPMNEEIHHICDRFVTSAIKGNLQKLNLQFSTNRVLNKMKMVHESVYAVPEIVFSEGSSLKFLRVDGCDFKSSRVLNLGCLRTLSLQNIRIEETFFERLMQSCPVLEDFFLQHYFELKTIKIVHDRIKKFVLSVSEQLEALEIHLPNLESVKYKGYYSMADGYMVVSKFDTLNKLGVEELHSFCLKHTKLEVQTLKSMQFKNLKTLLLHYIEVENAIFVVNDIRFPSLELLSLKGCKGIKDVAVMNLRIEALTIADCADLEYCKILAPNLLFFRYQGAIVDMAPVLTSKEIEVNLNLMPPENHEHDDILVLAGMMEFLQAFSGASEMTMTLIFNCYECMPLLQESNILPLDYVQHLEVEIRFVPSPLGVLEPARPDLAELLEGLFYISKHCNTLSMNLDSFHIKLKFQGFDKENSDTSFALIYAVKLWIKGFSGSKNEMKLVSYILGQAENLKYISISLKAATQITYSKLKIWTKRLEKTFRGVYVELNQ